MSRLGVDLGDRRALYCGGVATLAINALGATATGDIAGFEAIEAGILIRFLRELGHRVVEPDSPEATHFVSLDHDRRAFGAVAARVAVDRRILVVLEPRVVKPVNYRRKTQARYGTVFAFTRHAGPGTVALPLPQHDWRERPVGHAVRRPGTTVLINSNKLSSIPGSQYGLRRKVIQAFSDENLPLILAGSGWLRRGRALFLENLRAIAYAMLNRELPLLSEWAVPLRLGPSVEHIGKVDDKEAVLLTCEFVAAIENSRTYVSEKLFDAVFAGCVPLYVGAPLASYGIPSAVAVELPSSAAAFVAAVRTLTTQEKDAVLAAGRQWIASDEVYNTWAMSKAMRRLADEIHAVVEATPAA